MASSRCPDHRAAHAGPWRPSPLVAGAVGGRLPDRGPRWRERTRGRRRDRLRLQRRARLSTRCVQPRADLGRSAAPRGPAQGRGDPQPRSTACPSGARGRACRPLGVLRPAGRAPPGPAHPARGGVGSAAGLGEPGSQWPPTPSTDPPAGGRHHRRGPIVWASWTSRPCADGAVFLSRIVRLYAGRHAGTPTSTPRGMRQPSRWRSMAVSRRRAWRWSQTPCGRTTSRSRGVAFCASHCSTWSVGRRLPQPDRPRPVRAEMVVIPTVWARNRKLAVEVGRGGLVDQPARGLRAAHAARRHVPAVRTRRQRRRHRLRLVGPGHEEPHLARPVEALEGQ